MGVCFVLSLTAACAGWQESGTGRHGGSPGKRYTLTGKIVSVDKNSHRVTIAHQAISGYMGAMVMPFALEDNTFLDVMEPGDDIKATLVVASRASWLEDISLSHEVGGQSGMGQTNPVPDPQPGESVPDFALINQDGQRIDLGRYRGKALLLTFIYTRCPLPDYCILMSNNFAEIDKALQNDPALFARTHLLSISFDPEHDTPQALRSYGEVYAGKQPGEAFNHWEFASGTPNEVKDVTHFFGLSYWPDSGQIVHSLRTAIITPDGKIYKIYKGNEWKPADVLNDLRNMKLS